MRDEVLRADALDAVRITRWLRVEADDHELAALDLGHHHKVSASQFARVYGFAPQKGQNNRQGVRDRRDRLRAALDHGVRDEKILRRDRLRAEADAAWATQHDDELRALAAALLDHAEHLADLSDGDEDVTDWLAELHEQHHHGTRPDSYLTTIRLTADALAALSPYTTAHFNRFGRYNLDLTRVPPALDYDAPILSPDPRHKSSEAGPS